MHKHRFYKAEVMIDGALKPVEKTFFPSHWSRKKVVSKTIEAARNIKIKKLQKNNNWLVRGTTTEGIDIIIIINSKKNGITAFPILKI